MMGGKFFVFVVIISLLSLGVATATLNPTVTLDPVRTGEFYSQLLAPGLDDCMLENGCHWEILSVKERIVGQDVWHPRKTNNYWQLPLGLSFDTTEVGGQLFGVLHHRPDTLEVPCDKFDPGVRPSEFRVVIRVRKGSDTPFDRDFLFSLVEGDSCSGGVAVPQNSFELNFDEEGHETAPDIISVDSWLPEQNFALGAAVDAEGRSALSFSDKFGNLVKVIDAAGVVWEYEYDASNNLACVKMPGRTGSCWDDGLEKLSIEKDNLADDGFVKYEYDPLGRIVWSYHPDDGVKKYFYDAAGNPVLVVQEDVNGVERGCYLSGFDVSSRLLWSAFDGETTNCFDYYSNEKIDSRYNSNDDESRIIALQPYRHMIPDRSDYYAFSGGEKYVPYSFIAYQLPVNEQYQLEKTALFDVSPFVTTVTYYDGNDDGFPCLDDASVNADSDFSVGQVCGRTRVDNGELISKREFGYDKKGRLVKEIITVYPPAQSPAPEESYSFIITYAYDFAGNVVRKNVSGDLILEPFWYAYTYDAANRLQKISVGDSTGDSQDVVHSLSYDASGKILSFKQGADLTTVYAYDAKDQLTSLSASGSAAYQRSYTYDKVGNMISLRDGAREGSFAYDDLDRLTTVSNGPTPYYEHDWLYEYDPLGNRLEEREDAISTYYSYNNHNNQLKSVAGESYQFDAWGNVVQVGAHDNFVYDQNNMLIRAEMDDDYIEEYVYDETNKRLFKFGDDDKLYLYLYDASGSLVADFIIGQECNGFGDDGQLEEPQVDEVQQVDDSVVAQPTQVADEPETAPVVDDRLSRWLTARVVEDVEQGDWLSQFLQWFYKLFSRSENIGGFASNAPSSTDSYSYDTGSRTAYVYLGLKQVARINLAIDSDLCESFEEGSQPIDSAPSSADDSAPVVDDSAPVVDDSAPVVDDSAPVVDDSAPVVDEPITTTRPSLRDRLR